MVYTPDTTVWPLLVELKECLCQELTTAELLPGDCFCGILPGSDVPYDYNNGMAWVRLTGANPSRTFPNTAVYTTGCGAPLAFGVEVGALACIPGLAPGGAFPTTEVRQEAASIQIATMQAMRRAITCCMPKGLEILLQSYTPIGPEGGLVGGTWTASISEEF
jgi:hypothetical protein